MVKNLPANAGGAKDLGLIPGSGRSPGIGNGSPLSILAWKVMDRGAWWATVHGVASTHTHRPTHTHPNTPRGHIHRELYLKFHPHIYNHMDNFHPEFEPKPP